jgi:hypothetical protein
LSIRADYFEQYQPFSVNDMLVRIPGIDVARGGGGESRRGLGAGGDQILINGRRIAGKGNEGNAQLSRIAATEVEYIEIIRGTSGDLDVRGGSQVINVVLKQAEASVSYAYEINADHYHDGKVQPGSKVSATGQNGALNFFLSAELEPRWEFRDGFERGLNVDGSVDNTVDRDQGRDAWPTTLQANFGYEFSRQDTANLICSGTTTNTTPMLTGLSPTSRAMHRGSPTSETKYPPTRARGKLAAIICMFSTGVIAGRHCSLLTTATIILCAAVYKLTVRVANETFTYQI